MKKRIGVKSQATVFIIIAIVIIGAVAGSVYIINENKKAEASRDFFSRSDVKPSLEIIESRILDCSKEIPRNSLDKIGIQGGYFKKPANKPEYYFDLGWAFIPYYYYQGLFLMPNKQTIENQLSLYVNENLGDCLKKINYENFELSFRTPRTISSIKEKEVSFLIALPVKIKKDSHSIILELKEHPITINSELNAILNIANFITETHKQDPAMYCVSCVGQLADEDNLYVDIIKFRENEMLVVISENHTYSEPYSFEFLNKYKGDEVSPLNLTIEIAPEPQQS